MLAALAFLPASGLAVSAVSIADVPIIGNLSALTSMTVSDSADSIKSDLILDAGSQLAAHHTAITSLTVLDGPISLRLHRRCTPRRRRWPCCPAAAWRSPAHRLATLRNSPRWTPLSSMTVIDSEGGITADLQSGASNSLLDVNAAKISSITATGGMVA